jgi:hypothetical protein
VKAVLSGRIAWTIWAVSIVVTLVGTALGEQAAVEYSFSLVASSFATVGLLIRVRQPANPIGCCFPMEPHRRADGDSSHASAP